MLQFWVRVDLRVMAMKEYSAFPGAPRLKHHHQMVYCQMEDTRWREVSTEMQLAFSMTGLRSNWIGSKGYLVAKEPFELKVHDNIKYL